MFPRPVSTSDFTREPAAPASSAQGAPGPGTMATRRAGAPAPFDSRMMSRAPGPPPARGPVASPFY